MEKIKSVWNFIYERLFSTTYQIKRIILLTAIALVLAVVSFAGYYIYDRYHRSQPPIAQQSIVDAESAVRSDPQSIDKRVSLAEVYLLNRKYPEALSQASQVLQAQPNNETAWLIEGVAYANNGKPAQAIEPLTKFYDAHKDEDMAGLDRELQTASYYLGDVYLQLDEPDKAIEPLTKTVAWSQTDADAMYKLGLAFTGVQDYASALDMFSQAVTFVPDFTEAYQAMEQVYTASNQPDLATYAQGMIALSKKDYKTALDLLLKATQSKPDFAPGFAGLGMVYEATKDLQNAKSAYEAASNLDPNNFAATNGLLRVNSLLNK